jgi:putative permease
MQVLTAWFKEKMSDTELVMLIASLIVIFTLLILLGDTLAPLFVAIALAYVLDGIVALLHRCRIPRLGGIILVGIGTLLFILFTLLAVLPLLTEQIGRLVMQVPAYVGSIRDYLQSLQEQYAGWINPGYVQQLFGMIAGKLQQWGGDLVSFSLSTIPGLITLLVYAVLVPVLVFFLLKDKMALLGWSKRFLPDERVLLQKVWNEVDIQIGNYIRGKFWEMLIVGVVTWIALWWFDHEYALLLGALTGVSVWVPFVGAAVVTIPVVLLSLFQWGATEAALYALLAYSVVQLLDANVLVPWLFSEVVNLHPIAIVVAILIFGSLWGVLGVFIAIPMAALVQAVLGVVMNRHSDEQITADGD